VLPGRGRRGFIRSSKKTKRNKSGGREFYSFFKKRIKTNGGRKMGSRGYRGKGELFLRKNKEEQLIPAGGTFARWNVDTFNCEEG
jgi:hypothetical protein